LAWPTAPSTTSRTTRLGLVEAIANLRKRSNAAFRAAAVVVAVVAAGESRLALLLLVRY
jgi:hypothetical protein